ncbi:MAG TPA: metal ABC transporter permease [Gallionellaceae bacterium]|nr:metal ABC transporter permease [Gallionellaceae bacterium]
MNDIDISIIIPAFIAGLLILLTHVPLGIRVLQRGIIFADLAVAQIAGLGVVIAGLAGYAGQPLIVQLFAVASALLAAALLTYIERCLPDVLEASIGLLFVLAASGGILLMSHDTHSGEHLKDLLVGQILWVSNTQLISTALLSAAILAIWIGFRQKLGSFGFYALFALAVTASVQLVGVYLVFASLIVPALATHKLHHKRMLIAFAVGLAGYAAGLLLSVWLDLPSGAAIVWAMALAGAAAMLMWRNKPK